MERVRSMVEQNMMLSNVETVESLSRRANDMLHVFNLDDAEDLYLKLIYNLRDKPNYRKELVVCYKGLAEVYMNHGNAFRADCDEWQWGCIQGMVLLRKAIAICSSRAATTTSKDTKPALMGNRNRHNNNNNNEICKMNALNSKTSQKGAPISSAEQAWFVKERASLSKRLMLVENSLVKSMHKTLQQSVRMSTKELVDLAKGKIQKTDIEKMQCISQLENLRKKCEDDLISMQDILLNSVRNRNKLVSRKYKADDVEVNTGGPLRRAASLDCLERSTVINYRAVRWHRRPGSISEDYIDDDQAGTMQSTGAKRPKSLHIQSVTRRLSMDEQVQKAVSFLKEKAKNLKRSHLRPLSSFSSWRALKQQHESILDEALVDFQDYDNEPDATVNGFDDRANDGGSNVPSTTSEKTSHSNMSLDSSLMESSPESPESTLEMSDSFDHDRFMSENRVYQSETRYTREVRRDGEQTHTVSRTEVRNKTLGGIDVNRILNLSRHGDETIEPLRSDSTLDNILLRLPGYNNAPALTQESTPSPHESRHYRLDSFTAFSPVTETSSLNFEKLYNCNDGKTRASVFDILPINSQEVQLTLAYCFYRLANLEFEKECFPKATALYEQALAVFHDVYKLGILDDCMAQALKNSGKIRVIEGDITGGVGLMEQAIRLLEKFHNTQTHPDIANIWFEMGNAYISKQTQGESMYDHLSRRVRKELYSELVTISSDDEDESNESTDEEGGYGGETYSINTYEALRSYQHAYSILKELHSTGANENYLHDLVKVLTRLGDCSVITDDYDEAINYYEDALKRFPNSFNSGLLPDNAHVMSVLGVVRILLRNYTKATKFLECAHIMYQNGYADKVNQVEVSFTLSMLSLAHYASKNYYKSISWALRAINIYGDLYNKTIPNLSAELFWLVNFTIYSIAYAHLTLSEYNKALHFLLLTLFYCQKAKYPDHVLDVLVLKACAHCYDCLEDHDNALKYYADAIAKNEENKKYKLYSHNLHQELLSKSAQMHVTMSQWGQAVEAFDIARDVQNSMEEDIKGDMVSLLHQLGQTHAMTCDVNKSIECYLECLEAYKEMHGTVGPEMAATFKNLATMCHVKASMSDFPEDVQEMTLLAEHCFKQALDLEFSTNLALKYANFLYYQLNYSDCALMLLRVLKEHKVPDDEIIVFSFIEQVLAPGCLDLEMEDEEIVVTSSVFIQYLLFLSFKELHLFTDAEQCIYDLMDIAYTSQLPQPFAILGYVLMEIGLYEEAAIAFHKAAGFPNEDAKVRTFCRDVCFAMGFYSDVCNLCYRAWLFVNRRQVLD
ncbi:uncharacterized protein LOC141906447 [Tubulanus polymorphus]|uniref:uncharacterized protein LOC141906447 n=1 Tax=Tubulanus polymorphus TaxID=672921 RepID=UPI003DA2FE01